MSEPQPSKNAAQNALRSTSEAIVCEVRYRLDPERLGDFEEYGRCWIDLVERHGGMHLGYFMPRSPPSDPTLSFPGLGAAGPEDVGVALFSFPDEGAYLRYRVSVSSDPHAVEVVDRFSNPPFASYERIFLRPVSRAHFQSIAPGAADKDEELPSYRLLTGRDDSAFCRRVSEALALGYQLFGSPAITFNGEHAVVAQALIRRAH